MRKYVNIRSMKKRITFISVLLLSAIAHVCAQPQAGYYTSEALDGKSGRTLELALQEIIYPHTQLGYDYLWQAYETTDQAPADSVAAYATGSYTQLVYDMYAWMRWFPKYYETGDHSQTGGINREHCVPNSWWGGKSGNAKAYTDLHHLYPADGAANNAKQNYPLGEYTNGMTLSFPTQNLPVSGPPYYVTTTHACSHVWNTNSTGASGGALKVFEPADMYKGDFARAYLYVVCAYENKVTWQTSENTMFSNDAFGYTDIASWAINLLLKWHRKDPVSDKEKERNNAVESLQNNRNPFVDYPELVEYIWGNKRTTAFSLANASLSYYSAFYPVETGDIDGGTVTATPGSALAGETVTLTATPDETHTFTNIASNWSVMNGSTPVTVTIGQNNTCTFTMPAHAVTVNATFVDDPSAIHYLLNEDFESITTGNSTTSGGSSSAWSGNDNFPTVSNAYQAGGAIKLGNGNNPGSITTKTIDLSQNNGRFSLSFDVKGWTSVEGNIIVTIKGQSQTVTYTATMNNDFQTKELFYTNGQANSTITIATSAKRAFLDNIRVYYTNGMKPAPESSWNKASFVAVVDDENEFPVYTNGNSEASVTYSSSNTHVAEVDAQGEVTIKAVGTTTISASTPETGTYKACKHSYALDVVSLDGDGSEQNPYTVSDVLALNNSRTATAWVSGIIVGWATAEGSYTTEKPKDNPKVAVALSDDEAVSNSIAVNLPFGSIRNVANLEDHVGNIGKTTSVKGSLGDSYYSRPGVKTNVSKLKLEDVTQLSVSSVGWGTYFADHSYEMPAGVTGYTVNYDGNALTRTAVREGGQTVPASSPLLLEAEPGTYTYAVVNSNASALTSNLYGNLTADSIAEVDGATYYYKLLKPENEPLGWYWGDVNGGRFPLGANRAYLALSAGAAGAPAHLDFGEEVDEPTYLNTLTEWQTTIDWSKPVYNILGQQVSRSYKGLVLQQGIKYLAR